MSNYTAADMSTAAANGHRDGYQAGYADAVKAVEAGKPAAVQEAVAYCQPDDPLNSSAFSWPGTDRKPSHTMPLYAAPVAAAPVVAYLIDGRIEQGLAFDKAAAEKMAFANCGTVRPLVLADAVIARSTPAAPGIDLRKLTDSWLEQVERVNGKSPDKAAGMWACAKELRDALDASPKGGCTDNVNRAAFQRWAVSQGLSVQRSDFHVGMAGDYVVRDTVLAWEAWQASTQTTSANGGSDAARLDSGMIRLAYRDGFGEQGHILYTGVDLRSAIDAAMQATSAEVGA